MQDSTRHHTPNALVHEVSPYLLQHAYNPVHWQAWGPAAFERAQRENKAVFVSIGYATCHWCHVMEHESFEDQEVADYLNAHYICVKVDREERPDIDAFCMDICQSLTGHGGWPLTILMDAQRRPFFAGTYYPKLSSPGRLGFLDLMQRIQYAWVHDHDQIASTATEIARAVQDASRVTTAEDLPADMAQRVLEYHERTFDDVWGGFGTAPKFPAPHHLLCLMRLWPDAPHVRRMVTTTLDAMRAGGMYDHVALGFHRYSTDREWRVPHFEKMMIDQAMHLWAYAEAWKCTGDDLYRQVAGEIASAVAADFTVQEGSGKGAFASAIDADAAGEEGSFLTWTYADLARHLDVPEASDAMRAYLATATSGGNYHDEASGHATGTNIPYVAVEALRGVVADEAWHSARMALLAERKLRQQPLTDDKVVLDANGLMIAALATAGQIFGDAGMTSMAERAYDTCVRCCGPNPERDAWVRRYRNGVASIDTTVDDHAMIAFGAWSLYKATGNQRYLTDAGAHIGTVLEDFSAADGSLFRARGGTGELPARIKDGADGATPSGTSIAALVLAEMGRTTEALHLVRGVGIPVARHPAAYCALMVAWHSATTYKGMLHADAVTALQAASVLPLHVPIVVERERTTTFAMHCMADRCTAPVTDHAGIERLIGEFLQ